MVPQEWVTSANTNAECVDHHHLKVRTIVTDFLLPVNVVTPKLHHMPISDPLLQWHCVLLAQFIYKTQGTGVAETNIQVIELTVHLYVVNKTSVLFHSFHNRLLEATIPPSHSGSSTSTWRQVTELLTYDSSSPSRGLWQLCQSLGNVLHQPSPHFCGHSSRL